MRSHLTILDEIKTNALKFIEHEFEPIPEGLNNSNLRLMGIYVLYKQKQIIRIGITRHLFNRLKVHKANLHFDHIVFHGEVDWEECKATEEMLLQALQPITNFHGTGRNHKQRFGRRPKLNPYQRKALLHMRRNGLTLTRIGDILNVSHSTISRELAKQL